jgi:hypothetical protein
VGNLDKFKEEQIEAGEINSEELKESDGKNSRTVAYFIPDAPEAIANQVVPFGYKLDVNKGLVDTTGDAPQSICPHIILFDKVVEDPNQSVPEFCELIFYKTGIGRWEKQKVTIGTADLMFGEGLKVITSSKMAMEPHERQKLAKFFVKYMRANEYLFDRYKLVTRLGLSKESGKFVPFTDDKLYINQNGGTKIGKIVTTLKEPRREESEAPCRQLINELKEYPVFVLNFSAVLASPIVSWLPKKENIGVEVHGKSRSGKTTVQEFALKAGWGNIGTKTSWKSSNMGILNLLPDCSSIPFIMDDSHMIDFRNKDIPHAILNGDPRMKNSEVTKQGGVKGFTIMDTEPFSSVYLFNGEEKIATKVADKTNDSAGLHGRIISVNEVPFGDLQDTKQIMSWESAATKHGGYFLHQWMDFLNEYDREQFEEEWDGMIGKFSQENEFQRSLATKAAVLLWAITKFGELCKIEFDLDALIKLINTSMEEATDGVDRASKFVAALVKAAMSLIEFPEGDMEFGKSAFGIGSVTGKAGDQVVAVYKHGDSLMIQNTLFDRVVDKHNSTPTAALEVLRGSGLLVKNKDNKEIANWSRPKTVLDSSDGPKIYGIKLSYDAIKGLISF